MITIASAKSGAPVIRKDDKWLGSSVDPIREAKVWAEKVSRSTASDDVVIVLGLATGYHVIELISLRGRDRVTVIENDQKIFESARMILPKLAGAKIIVEPEWMRLVERQSFRDAVGGPYRVADYGPARQNETDYYNSVEKLLRGRDRLSFLLLLKARPDFHALLEPEAIGAIPEEAISIKTLEKLFAAHSGGSRERRLWRVLGELVK